MQRRVGNQDLRAVFVFNHQYAHFIKQIEGNSYDAECERVSCWSNDSSSDDNQDNGKSPVFS